MATLTEKQEQLEALASQLSVKHLMFANNVLDGQTQKEAYTGAGYSEKQAKACASRLLQTNANLSAYLELAKEIASLKACHRYEITIDRVTQELAALGFGNLKNLYDEQGALIPVHLLPDYVTASITEVTERVMRRGDDEDKAVVIERKYKVADKRGSLELLGKTDALKMFTDKKEVDIGAKASLAELLAQAASDE